MKKKIEKTVKNILLLTLCLFLFSCEEEQDFFEPEQNKPTSSVMAITYNDKTYSTVSSVYQIDLNLDESLQSRSTYQLNFKHLYQEQETNGKWTFGSDNLKLSEITENSCKIDGSQLTGLGTYSIKATSSISEQFDKIFIINTISSVAEIAVKYEIQPEYRKNNLNFTDEMISGTITRFTKELTLAAGAVYNFKVCDISASSLPVSNITTSKSNSNVIVREIYGNTAEVVCKQADNVDINFTVKIGNSDVSLSFNIKLKDISNSTLHTVETKQDTEQIISLNKNTEQEQDREYTYLIETNSVSDGRVLQFSIDYEIWDRNTEEQYLKTPAMEIPKNKTVNWFQHSAPTYSFEEKELFELEVDGVSGKFKIKPINDTTYFIEENGEQVLKNLHCYLYVKYAEDSNTTYRYRWRIMIGGILEELKLSTVQPETGEETEIKNDIAIRENDQSGWIFRANYVPETTQNNKTLWYIASSKNKVLWYDIDGRFYAPAPVQNGSIANKVLNMMEGKAYPEYEPYRLSAFDVAGNQFEAYYYYYQESDEGFSDLWTTYNSLGQDIVLVALNIETKHCCCVGIKDLGDKQIIVKSLAEPPIEYKSIQNGKTIKTGYESTDKIQKFPNTLVDGYLNFRTFYMKVDEELKLEISSSFKMENLDVYGSGDAREILPNITADLDLNGMSGEIKLQTYYNMLDGEQKNDKIYNSCITDGVIVYIVINNTYKILLRIVIYDL